MNVTKNGQVILTGTKGPTRNLYMVSLHDTIANQQNWPPTVTQATAGSAYDFTQTMQQLAFLHDSAGYPTHSTFLRAIHWNYYLGWPHLTLQRAAPLLQKSVHTANGHVHMLQKHIHSSQLPPDNTTTDPPVPRAPVS